MTLPRGHVWLYNLLALAAGVATTLARPRVGLVLYLFVFIYFNFIVRWGPKEGRGTEESEHGSPLVVIAWGVLVVWLYFAMMQGLAYVAFRSR